MTMHPRGRVLAYVLSCTVQACTLRQTVADPEDCACAAPWEQTTPPPLLDASDTAFDAGALDHHAEPAVSVLTWNIEWFAHPQRGPTDDAEQVRAVIDVLARSHKTLVALQEVSSETAFSALLHAMPAYAGVLSSHPWEQKTALLWDRARFELVYAHGISRLDDAGRPPLSVLLRRKRDAALLLCVVIHAKAQSDADSHARRQRFAVGLKAVLDATHADTALLLLGDFNDRLEGSITAGVASPYRELVGDPGYLTPTAKIDAENSDDSSHVLGVSVDHIVLSDELAPYLIEGSVEVLREELLTRTPTYVETVSDHFPVTLSLDW